MQAELARKAFRGDLADVPVYREVMKTEVRPFRVRTPVAPKRNSGTQDVGGYFSQNYEQWYFTELLVQSRLTVILLQG